MSAFVRVVLGLCVVSVLFGCGDKKGKDKPQTVPQTANKLLTRSQQLEFCAGVLVELRGYNRMFLNMLESGTMNLKLVGDYNRQNNELSQQLKTFKFDKDVQPLAKILGKACYYYGIYGAYYNDKDQTNFNMARKGLDESLKSAAQQLSALDPVFKFREVVRILEAKKVIPGYRLKSASITGNALNITLRRTFSKLDQKKQQAYKQALIEAWYMIDKQRKAKVNFIVLK